MPPFGAYFKSTREGRLLRVAFLGARRGKYILYIYYGNSLGITVPARTRNVRAAMRHILQVDPLRVDSLDGGNAQAYLHVLIHMYIMCIFLCKYVCIAVVCLFGGWLLRPRKYGGGGHASLAGRDLPPPWNVLLDEKVQLHLASIGREGAAAPRFGWARNA